MTIPANVEALLNKHRINYQLTETPAFGGSAMQSAQYLGWAGAIRSVILKDGKGKLQAIIPADSMLDLALLNQMTGRDLRVVPSEELDRIITDNQLSSLPALPQLTGLPTIVDESVLAQPEIILESGGDADFLHLQQRDFKQMLDGVIIGDISADIPVIAVSDKSDDLDLISKAVGKFTSLRIQQRLEDTLEFPPLPETAQRIIKLRVNPDADIKDLSDIVEIDPSLSAQIVSWAASPYYAAPGKIKSVHDAIVRVLGFDLVMNLALGLALGKTLKVPDDQAHGFSGYWQQAVYTAATVEELVKAIPAKQRPHMGMSCLGGLLHNFGYLILAEVFPPYFSFVCRYLEANPHVGHSVFEHHLIGIDRDRLGAWLMDLWSMPEEVCVALRYQNDVNYEAEGFEYANLLFIASRLLKHQGVGDSPLEEVPEAMFERLGLDREDARLAVDNVIACAEEIQNLAKTLGGG